MLATENVTRLADYRAGATLPLAPTFFASRIVAEGRKTKVVEYCALDVFGVVRLQVTVKWNADARHPDLWTPSTTALAALLLLGQLFEGERVVIERHVDDEVLLPLNLGIRVPEVIALNETLARSDLQRAAVDLEDQVALLRFDPSRAANAHGDATFLRSCWVYVVSCLRPELTMTRPRAPVAPRPLPPTPSEARAPAWAWCLGVIFFVQTLASGALWLFPGAW